MLFVALTQSIGHDYCDVWLEKAKVIVASIPEDNIGLSLSLSQNHLVVNTGIEQIPFLDVEFIFLADSNA